MFENSKNPLLYLSAKAWRFAGSNRPYMVGYIFLSVISSAIWSLEPILIGFFLNELQAVGVTSQNAWYFLLLLSVFLLQEGLFWAFHGPSRVIEMKNAFIVRSNYKKYLLEGTMAFPIEWHVDHHSGDTIDKIEKGTGALYNFSENIFQYLQGIIMTSLALLALLYFDPMGALIVAVISIPIFLVIAAFDKKLVPGYKIVNTYENAVTARIFDTLSNITTVIILRIETLVFKTISMALQKPFDQFYKNAKTNELKWFFAGFLGRLSVVLVLGFYIWRQVSIGPVLVGTLYILYGYVNQIRETFFRFAYLYNDVVRYRASVANAEEISKDFKKSEELGSRKLPRKWQELSVEQLSFSYGAAEEGSLHLNDVCVTIKKGERIALIGESGGGKSTFLKLLRDLYHPKSLNLSVDGRPFRGGFAAISNSISLVPQDPEIFSTTIRENITLGVEATEQHIEVFTDMAKFTEVVKRLPKGLDSSIVERGVNLSGGEKQRLALSRGLLASEDKEIILLDEPTSSVDFHNELEIYKNIFELFSGKTVISSIHRLHLLSLFDTVYFFKNGKIVVSGSFEHLKETSPEFQDLWKKYIETRDAA